MIQAMKYVDKLDFDCPICHGSINRIIKEDNCLPINKDGQIDTMRNTLYEDFFECSNCKTNLDHIIKYSIDNGYFFTTKGCELLIIDKMEKNLSFNPFGINK